MQESSLKSWEILKKRWVTSLEFESELESDRANRFSTWSICRRQRVSGDAQTDGRCLRELTHGMSQGAAQQEPEHQRQFQHGGSDHTCRGTTNKDNASDTAAPQRSALAERAGSLTFGASRGADGPRGD